MALFGKVKDVRIIPKLVMLLKEEGFPDLTIKYIGED